MKQSELARRAGVIFQTVHLYEVGAKSIPTATVVRLAAALGVPPSEILSVLDEVE